MALLRGEAPLPGRGVQAGIGDIVACGPVPHRDLRQLPADVKVPERLRRVVGRVRPHVGHPDEQRPRGVALRYLVEAHPGGPVGRMIPFFQVPGPGRPGVGAAAVCALPCVGPQLFLEPGQVVVHAFAEVVEDDVVETEQLAGRVHVSPAHADAVVASPGKLRGEGRGGGPGRAGIADQAACVAALASVHTPARTGGGGYLGVRVREIRTVIHERIHVRRLHYGVPGDAQVVPALLVSCEQDDVWAVCHANPPDLYHC